jgi:hypothetical protein
MMFIHGRNVGSFDLGLGFWTDGGRQVEAILNLGPWYVGLRWYR